MTLVDFDSIKKTSVFTCMVHVQYSQRGTFINPLTPVVRIIHARSNTPAEYPLTLVVMTLVYRDDRTRGQLNTGDHPKYRQKTPIAVVIFSEHVEVNRGDGCSNEGSALAVL